MYLGHTIGSAVRERIREPDSPRGAWHQVGQITIERVRTVVEALDPVRHEVWLTQSDERTCPVCGQLNGKMWREGEGFSPPVHDHCRCERVYHHTEFRSRFVEQWQDIVVSRFAWEWRRTS